MAGSPKKPQAEAADAAALASNSAFMDKYSRQIGAFGMEAMSKLIQLKVKSPERWNNCGWMGAAASRTRAG